MTPDNEEVRARAAETLDEFLLKVRADQQADPTAWFTKVAGDLQRSDWGDIGDATPERIVFVLSAVLAEAMCRLVDEPNYRVPIDSLPPYEPGTD